MYAITGITGNVGGSVANNLLAAGRPVRAVMRNVGKGDVWAKRGCEVVQADIADATSLASAFKGAEGVFVLVPPNFDPAPGFPEARATAASLKSALERADPDRVVHLSTIGAQRVNPTCLHSTPSLSRRWGSCRCRLLSFDPHGSWRIFAGMSPRRERAGPS
jgi:uncharacterized protein YbjT (DUF2867 family)